jgi:hypothetical protein
LLTGLAAAQPHYALPGAAVRESPESLTFHYEGEGYSYAAGLGWLNLDAGLSAPVTENGLLYLEDDVLNALGVALPRLRGVRSSGGGTVRVVFDFGALTASELEPLRQTGALTPERPLRLRLPPLLVARTLRERLEGFTLRVMDGAGDADATVLQLGGPTARYTAFPLANPTRLVVDLRADPGAADALLDAQKNLLSRLTRPREGVRELGGGVTLRSFSTPTVAGSSRVDLVEIAPNRGRFRVEGGSYDLRTPSELTGAALVGLNASYFDPESGRSIGFLKGRGRLESLPSRGRAAVGFGFGDPVVGRPEGTLEVTVTSDTGSATGTLVSNNLVSSSTVSNNPVLNNSVRRLELGLLEERVALHTVPGAWVGSPRQGAVVVSATGRVLENMVGPSQVPAGGFVLSYLPELRALARVDAGDTVTYRLETRPSVWRFVPEAVEAGPLLIADGRSAYRPGLEAFDTRDRESNINRRTTRAALGVRADGTVLLLVATELTAAELVPLFLRLGAEDALQLDSGGSSTLVVGGEVINRPALLQRRVATVITYTPLSAAALPRRGRE